MGNEIVPIKKLQIKNFRCVYDATVDLDWFTVLIGKNDTGKTSILDAVYLLGAGIETGALRKGQAADEALKEISSHSRGSIEIGATYENGRKASFDSNPKPSRGGRRGNLRSGDLGRLERVQRSYRLDPEKLRQPAPTGKLEGAPLEFDGTGLVDALDRMPHKTFGALLEEFCNRIPDVEEVLLETAKRGQHFQQGTKEIRFLLKNGDEIPARQASDGAMLILGFLALIMDKNPPQLILIEEPENGIHPRQLEKLVQSLIDLSINQHRVQIVMTTHSPYVLDAVPEDCVRVVTRTTDEGTKVHKFAELADIKKKLGLGYSVGEAFANMADDDVPEHVK